MVIAVEYFLLCSRRAGGKVDCCVSFSCGSIIFIAWGQGEGCCCQGAGGMFLSVGEYCSCSWGQGGGDIVKNITSSCLLEGGAEL